MSQVLADTGYWIALLNHIEGRTNGSGEDAEQVPGRAAVGGRRAHQKSAPGGRIGICFSSGCPSGSRARTSSTSTRRVNTSAFRASADRNGGRVPAVLYAAISTNLQAGTGSRRLVDLAANAISAGTRSRFKRNATLPVSKACHLS